MNYRVEPFRGYHIDLLIAQGVQPAQQRALAGWKSEFAREQFPGTHMSVFLEGTSRFAPRGTLLLCGGIFPTGPRSGSCWALLSEAVAPHMRWLHYATQRFLRLNDWRRLEATVEEGFDAGCKWMKLLGFEYEGAMRAYGENGETHHRYAKVNI